jgi:hypothetical protein
VVGGPRGGGGGSWKRGTAGTVSGLSSVVRAEGRAEEVGGTEELGLWSSMPVAANPVCVHTGRFADKHNEWVERAR